MEDAEAWPRVERHLVGPRQSQRAPTDLRDRVATGAERRPGQREPPIRSLECVLDRLTPRSVVSGVVDLIEDHQRAPAADTGAVQQLRGSYPPELTVPDAKVAITSNGGAGALFSDVLLLGTEPAA